MFQNDTDRAIAYAAMKTLERMLIKDGSLAPGFTQDLSGCKITIELPSGSVVKRDAGLSGDGTIDKKAVQNLYGYALWAFMIIRLRKFKQWNAIRSVLIESMQEVIKNSKKTLREEIVQQYPDVEEEIQSIQSELDIPDRQEETPRKFASPKMPATITIERR